MWDYFLQHLDTIGILVVGLILIWQRWLSGSSGLRKEINDEYKERNAQLEAKLKECLDGLQATNLEVATLKGIIQEKDKHIESLTKILQDKNPETLNLLREIGQSNKQIFEFMKQVHAFLEKQSGELDYQTELLEGSREREKKIDKASKEHVGVPVRIPNGKRGRKIIKKK